MSAQRIQIDAQVTTVSSAVRIEAELLASVHRDDDADVFVSRVPVLGICSQGPTAEDARRGLEHAVRLYFITAYHRGVLRRILAGRDFGSSDASGAAPQYVRIIDDWRVPTRQPVAPTIAGQVLTR